jgi:hypothetical protein
MASANSSAQDSGSDFDRFMADNVHPAYASTDVADDDSAPEKERVTQADLMASAPDPAKETLGAAYHPSTTIKHGNPSQPGMPAGWVSAKNPQ